jgi:prepilin-type processing-associated H-X9-DG protein
MKETFFDSTKLTWAQARHAHQGDPAFALLELLCVLAVLGVLGMLHARGLATTRPVSITFQCLNNQRMLANAWRMYADDNSTKLPPNRDGSNAGKAAADASWAGGWLDYSNGNTDNTNTALLVNHQKWPFGAFLGPYLRSPAAFRCPADESLTRIGNLQHRVRSVSLNNAFGYNSRTWFSPSRYRLYAQSGQIGTPSGLFVFLDEHPGSINDPVFNVNLDTPGTMVDFPSMNHNGGANLSFADGHAEHHKWQDRRTTPGNQPGVTLTLNVVLPGNPDVLWIQQHASELK